MRRAIIYYDPLLTQACIITYKFRNSANCHMRLSSIDQGRLPNLSCVFAKSRGLAIDKYIESARAGVLF